MNLRQVYTFGLLTLLLLPLQSFGQGVIVDDGFSSDPSGSITNAYTALPVEGGYFWARGDYGERPGVDGDFFSSGAFIPIPIYGPGQTSFVDGRIWVSDDSNIGGDIGIGHRWMRNNIGVGLNGFITWDHSSNDTKHQRFSLGGEVFTDHLDFSANAYIPFNEDAKRFGEVIRTKASVFEGNNLFFQNRQWAEQQMTGGDVELAAYVPTMEWIRVAGGAYFWDSDLGENVDGYTVSVGFDLNSFLVDFSVNDDDLYGTTFNVGGEVRLGRGPFTLEPRYNSARDRMFDRVRKRSRVSLQNVLLTDQEAAINPATGLPFTFIHVDNTAAAGGDGSDGARFNELSLAGGPDGDIILVHRGDTTIANTLDSTTGLFMDDNQIIIGEGTPFLLQAANRDIACPLPGFDQMGTNPFISGDAGSNVINLANNNTVLGLNIVSPDGGSAIFGNGIVDFHIEGINQDLMASESGTGNGILLTDASGRGRIENFSYRGADDTSARGGIVIDNSNTGLLDLVIADVPNLEGGRAGIELATTNARIDAVITDVNASMNGDGLVTTAGIGGVTNVTLLDSHFDDATNHGARVGVEDGGMVTLNSLNNTFDNAVADGIHVDAESTGLATVNLTDTTMTGAGDDGFDAAADGGSIVFNMINATGSSSVAGNMATDNGIEISAINGGTVDGDVDDSLFSHAGGDAVNIFADSMSSTTFEANDTDFSNAGGSGVTADVNDGSSADITLTDTDVDHAATGDGVAMFLDNSTGTVDLTNVDANNVGGNGFNFESIASSDFTATLDDVNFDSAMMNAIKGISRDGSTATITGNEVRGINVGEDAINLFNQRSTLLFTLTESGPFYNASGDGIDLINSTDGIATIDISGPGGGPVNFADAQNYGLIALSGTNATTTINFDDGANFNSAVNDAIHLTGTDSTMVTFTGSNVSGMNAGNDGIFVRSDNTPIVVNLTETGSFINATGDGIDFRALDGGDVDITVTGTAANPAVFTNATRNGIFGSLSDSTGTLTLTDTTFDQANMNGMLVNSNNSVFTANITETSFFNATQTGMTLNQGNGSTNTVNLTGVDLRDAGTHGFLNNADGASTSTITMEDVQLDDAGEDAIHLTSRGGSTVDFTGSNGISGSNAVDDGTQLFADASTINFDLTGPSNFINSGGDGIEFAGVNAAVLDIDLTDVNYYDMSMMGAGYGLNGNIFDSELTLDMNDVDFNNAGDSGFFLNSQNSNVVANLDDVRAGNAGIHAFDIRSLNGSDVTVAANNISGVNAGSDGIHVVATDSVTDIDLTNVGNFSGAGADGIDVAVEGGVQGDFNFNLSNAAGSLADFSGAGGNGALFTFNDYNTGMAIPLVDVTVNHVNLSGAGANGLFINSFDSTFNVNVAGSAGSMSNLSGATENGIRVSADNNAPESLGLFEFLDASGALIDGIHLDATMGTNLDIDLNSSDISGAGDDTSDLDSDGGSMIDFTTM